MPLRCIFGSAEKRWGIAIKFQSRPFLFPVDDDCIGVDSDYASVGIDIVQVYHVIFRDISVIIIESIDILAAQFIILKLLAQ